MKRTPGVIFACDVSDVDLGLHLIRQTAGHIDVLKVGLEAMTAEHCSGQTLARMFRIRAQDHELPVFWDMKLNDTANTVHRAAYNIGELGSKMFTLHAQVSDEAIEAAVTVARLTGSLPLVVTVLTDLDDDACISRFGKESKRTVLDFAKNAYRLGIRGFVCSALEAEMLRDRLPFGDTLTIVTPAVRPLWAVESDEQKRVTTPTQAALAGVDYIVVGRPIYNPPPSRTNAQAAREIQEELAAA